jgi:methyl-accepting chemotaxis protein
MAASAASSPAQLQSGGGSHPVGFVFSEKFNKMLENADLAPELFEKLSKGLHNLSDTTSKLTNISEAASATSDYTQNIKKANDSISIFAENYQGSGQVLNESINILSESFQKTAGTVAESGHNFQGGLNSSVANLQESLTKAGQEVHDRIVKSGNEVAQQVGSAANNLSASYLQLADSMKANGEIVTNGTSGYRDQLDRLNKNMAALNAAHELHLQGTSTKLKESQEVYSGVEGMMKKLKTSIEETEKYAESVAKLNQNIASLNTVYGNMLSAMNVMSNNA